jgi:hypothetical protein
MKPGRAGTMTHDYKRHGTTTLFAALNILDGTVIGHNMRRHPHQEFIRFLNTIEAQVPKRKAIHAIVDNYATHKHPKVRAWLVRHPRWTFHFTPAIAYNHLGTLLGDQGKYAEAEPVLRRAFEIFQASFGPDHPNTLRAKSDYDSLRRLIDQKSGNSAR